MEAAPTLEGGLPDNASSEMQALFACVLETLRSETVSGGAIRG